MKFAIVMDPIAGIRVQTDTSLRMLLEAQRRGWETLYLEPRDLHTRDGIAYGTARPIEVFHRDRDWFRLGEARVVPLGEVDAIAMRKDPPFDMEYVYTTYALETAARQGAHVFNDPRGIRNTNEKYSATAYAKFMAPTLVTQDAELIRAFVREHGHAILKPLDWMGGAAIFHLKDGDPNDETVLDTFVESPRRTVMVQRFLPEIATAGDKRIFLIDGEPVESIFARFPKAPGLPANTARGGSYRKAAFTARDREICAALSPYLKANGLAFTAIDVIGDFLTEINVTSPTGVRAVQELHGVDVLAALFDRVEERCR